MSDLDHLSEDELLAKVDLDRLPCHIAVIMDGNRRWAKEHYLPTVFGHRAGVKAFRRVMELCRHLGVKVLTAYAFSAENWRRAPAEVAVLMQLFEHYAKVERGKMIKNNIRFKVLGNTKALPENVRREFALTAEATKDNTAMTLNLAVNYGGREEIIHAAQELAKKAQQGQIDPESINEEAFSQSLWSEGQPDPDLLIRTSGELRVSNFLLWQIAYSEFWFSNVYWPDVDEKLIYRALIDYQSRVRRYGGTA